MRCRQFPFRSTLVSVRVWYPKIGILRIWRSCAFIPYTCIVVLHDTRVLEWPTPQLKPGVSLLNSNLAAPIRFPSVPGDTAGMTNADLLWSLSIWNALVGHTALHLAGQQGREWNDRTWPGGFHHGLVADGPPKLKLCRLHLLWDPKESVAMPSPCSAKHESIDVIMTFQYWPVSNMRSAYGLENYISICYHKFPIFSPMKMDKERERIHPIRRSSTCAAHASAIVPVPVKAWWIPQVPWCQGGALIIACRGINLGKL